MHLGDLWPWCLQSGSTLLSVSPQTVPRIAIRQTRDGVANTIGCFLKRATHPPQQTCVTSKKLIFHEHQNEKKETPRKMFLFRLISQLIGS